MAAFGAPKPYFNNLKEWKVLSVAIPVVTTQLPITNQFVAEIPDMQNVLKLITILQS